MRKLPPPHAVNRVLRGAYEAPQVESFSVLKPMTLLSNTYFSADTAVEEYQDDSNATIEW